MLSTPWRLPVFDRMHASAWCVHELPRRLDLHWLAYGAVPSYTRSSSKGLLQCSAVRWGVPLCAHTLPDRATSQTATVVTWVECPMILQTETFDAEMEGLASNVKKKGKLPARHGHLEESISRHKQHIVRLEQMLRLLDNEVSHHHAPGAPVAARPCHFSPHDLGPESHGMLRVANLFRAEEPRRGMTTSLRTQALHAYLCHLSLTAGPRVSCESVLLQALAVDDMSNAKEMVDDYMERNQEDFDEFSTPDDVYEEILQDLDSLEVSEPCLQRNSSVHDKCL